LRWAESADLIAVSGMARIFVCEKKAGAGEAGFGFLEFGDVEWRDVEAASGDAGAGPRERCRVNDSSGEGQGVGGMRLGGIDVDPFLAGERRGVEPCAVGEERVAAKRRDGGFEMQAAGDGNGDDFIVVRRKDGGELADAFGVAAPGEADENFSVEAQDIAAFERAGKRNVFELSKLGEGLSNRRRFAAASLRAQRKYYRQFIENDGGIFDEHGVGKIGFSGKRDNARTQFAEQVLVSAVLLLGGGQINGLAVDEGKLATDDGGADGACDGCEHCGRVSLHENDAVPGNVERSQEPE
jgi:hypothetical protein